MDHEKEISIKMAGPHRQLPALGDFVAVCAALRECLKNVSRCVAGAEIEYHLRDLRSGSAVLEVGPQSIGIPESTLFDVGFTFKRTITDILDDQELDPRLDFSALKAFDGFSTPLRKDGVSVEVDGKPLGRAFASKLKGLLAPSSPSFGSVSGMLETVSVHLSTRFILYPPVHGEGIQCSFRANELGNVLDCIGQKVTVFGKLSYARTKIFPVRVEVEHFEIDPTDDAISSLLTARGILKTTGINPLAPGTDDDWD